MTFSEEQNLIEMILQNSELIDGADVRSSSLIYDVQGISPRYVSKEDVEIVIAHLISIGILTCVDSDPIKIRSLYTL